MIHRRDICPECGIERTELIVPGRFFCPQCERVGDGPNAEAPEGAQLQLGVEA